VSVHAGSSVDQDSNRTRDSCWNTRVRFIRSGCGSPSTRCSWTAITASSASFSSRPTVCSSRDHTSAPCWRSPRGRAGGSPQELASEVPLAMLRTTPIRREANHEDAVILDPDQVAPVPGEHVPDDRFRMSGLTRSTTRCPVRSPSTPTYRPSLRGRTCRRARRALRTSHPPRSSMYRRPVLRWADEDVARVAISSFVSADVEGPVGPSPAPGQSLVCTYRRRDGLVTARMPASTRSTRGTWTADTDASEPSGLALAHETPTISTRAQIHGRRIVPPGHELPSS
jgi:hypothetical protein